MGESTARTALERWSSISLIEVGGWWCLAVACRLGCLASLSGNNRTSQTNEAKVGKTRSPACLAGRRKKKERREGEPVECFGHLWARWAAERPSSGPATADEMPGKDLPEKSRRQDVRGSIQGTRPGGTTLWPLSRRRDTTAQMRANAPRLSPPGNREAGH